MRSEDNFIHILALVVLALTAGGIGIYSCVESTDGDRAKRTVEDMGFTDVSVGDASVIAPSFQGCGEGDSAAFDAQATNANGKRVSLVVCCGGIAKGCTVRSR